MVGVSLNEVAILLAALAIAGPLARWLGISAVLGYLVVGMLLGPNTIGWSFSNYKAQEILHFAEFGIVLLLFLIGLELRPKRLWAMRNAVFMLGSAQVLLTGAVLAGIGLFDRLLLADGAVRRLRAGAVVDRPCPAGHGGDRRSQYAPRPARLLRAAVPGPRRHSADRLRAAVRDDGGAWRRRRQRRWTSSPCSRVSA